MYAKTVTGLVITSHVHTQTEIHFIAPLITLIITLITLITLIIKTIMHAHCLHWLMSTGLLFQNAFCRPCKFMTGEMVPMASSKSDLRLVPLSVHICLGLVVDYWPIVGTCGRHNSY